MCCSTSVQNDPWRGLLAPPPSHFLCRGLTSLSQLCTRCGTVDQFCTLSSMLSPATSQTPSPRLSSKALWGEEACTELQTEEDAKPRGVATGRDLDAVHQQLGDGDISVPFERCGIRRRREPEAGRLRRFNLDLPGHVHLPASQLLFQLRLRRPAEALARLAGCNISGRQPCSPIGNGTSRTTVAPSTCHVHLAPPSPHAYLYGLEHVDVCADIISGLVMEVSARKVLPLSVSPLDRENDASDDRNRLDILQTAACGKLHFSAFSAPAQVSCLQSC